MPRYEVIADGFINGTLHKPKHPRHGFVNTDKPLDPVPSWLKEVKAATPAEKKNAVKLEKELKDKTNQDKQDVKTASFISAPPVDAQPGSKVETL